MEQDASPLIERKVNSEETESFLNLDDIDLVFDFKDLFRDALHSTIAEKLELLMSKFALKQKQALEKLKKTSPIQFKNKVSFVLGTPTFP